MDCVGVCGYSIDQKCKDRVLTIYMHSDIYVCTYINDEVIGCGSSGRAE